MCFIVLWLERAERFLKSWSLASDQRLVPNDDMGSPDSFKPAARPVDSILYHTRNSIPYDVLIILGGLCMEGEAQSHWKPWRLLHQSWNIVTSGWGQWRDYCSLFAKGEWDSTLVSDCQPDSLERVLAERLRSPFHMRCGSSHYWRGLMVACLPDLIR